MEKLRKILIISIICLLIGSILVYTYIRKNAEGDLVESETPKDLKYEEPSDATKKEQDNLATRLDYFVINNCMNTFLSTINVNSSRYYSYNESNQLIRMVTDDEIQEYVYNLLSNRYVQENNIQKNNVFKYINKLDESVTFVPIKLKQIQDSTIKSYIIYGIATNMLTNEYVKDIYAVVNLDPDNMTFSIEILDENYSDIDDINVSMLETNIMKNEMNTFEYPVTTTEELTKNYLNIYKKLALAKPEIIYNMLDNQYKTKRFPNLGDFKKYVNQNKEYILSMNVNQYKESTSGNETMLIVLDQNGNYTIFNEKYTLDFSIMLDAYTIDLPEFTQKYESAKNENKVGMNIEKIKEAINNKDYKYVYEKLDKTFKQNNYPTQQSLEQYLDNTLFDVNNFEYKSIEQQENLYIYTVTVTDKTGNKDMEKQLSIVMQLKENRDFIMSFSLQE